MNKILLENRLDQTLPILLKSAENPKELVQSQIPSRGRKLITPAEMSHHISSLAGKKYIRITYMESVDTSARLAKLAQKASLVQPPKVEAPVAVAAETPAPKKKTPKKGRK